MRKKDIKSYNEKGNPHGYWEVYNNRGDTLYFKGHAVDNLKCGYWEEIVECYEGDVYSHHYHTKSFYVE